MTEYNVYGKKSYAYAIGRISGTSHRVLRTDEMARLREADSETAQKLLADYGYPAINGDKTVYDVIEDEKNAVSAFVREIAPDEELTQLLFFEEDALNLKLLLKSEKIGKEVDLDTLCEGGFQKELLRICVKTDDYSMLGETLETALTGIEKEENPCRISCLVDNAVFSYALITAQKKNCRPLTELFTVYGEGKNRLTALRLQKLGKDLDDYAFAFLPVKKPNEMDIRKNEAEILTETAKALDNVLTDLGYGDGIGVIAQYYFRKKTEAQALRLLFAQKRAEESRGDAG
ncbi:MAG: V-type ATPase subunit [Candidatus Fimenecus sp.]